MNQNTLKELMDIRNKTREVPLIVIVNNVIYPNIYLPLEDMTLEMEKKTIAEAVNEHDGYFVITTQMDESEDDTPMIYQVGTLCQITKYENDNATRIEYQALFKYKINKMELKPNGRFAEGELLTSEFTQEVTDQEWGLHHKLFSNFVDYLKTYKKEFHDKYKVSFLSDPDAVTPSELISMCFVNLNMNIQVKQSILESASYSDSFLILLDVINIGLSLKKNYADIQKKLGDLNQKNADAMEEETDFVEKINAREFPADVRKIVKREVKRMTSMPPTSSEYHTIENYLTTLYDYPWAESTEVEPDLNKTKALLESEHFGLEKVKKRILRQLATHKLTNKKNGLIICLDGPPGVGKTSICKSIADSLNREYIRIGLGGVSDEAEIRGHRKTYVGAMAGKIVNAMIKSKVKNPLIVLDEIDKIGQNSTKGSVDSALLEVLDPEQNTNFNDHFLNTPVDLSDVLFIATSNDIGNISQPLRDRMEIIHVGSYTIQEKFHIAKNHLIPKEKQKLGMENYSIEFTDSVIKTLIESYTREAGVRGLKKLITEVYQHCAENLLDDSSKKIVINNKNISSYVDRKAIQKEKDVKFIKAGLVSGLAWTSVGGEVLLVEAISHKGNGKLSITGQLGDVMKESAQIALTLIKVICEEKSIEFNFNDRDIHIHFPAGATPKDGPSAGITLLSVLYSLVTNKIVKFSIAMTGEISLRGEVLPVGGIKEKIIGAYKNGKKLVFIPKSNKDDIDDIPQEILNDPTFKIKPVGNYKEVFKELFE